LGEWEAFTLPTDNRNKLYYLVTKDRLLEVCPELKNAFQKYERIN